MTAGPERGGWALCREEVICQIGFHSLLKLTAARQPGRLTVSHFPPCTSTHTQAEMHPLSLNNVRGRLSLLCSHYTFSYSLLCALFALLKHLLMFSFSSYSSSLSNQLNSRLVQASSLITHIIIHPGVRFRSLSQFLFICSFLFATLPYLFGF